jgi:RimJ/RimL family protein N-acetyltransferase
MMRLEPLSAADVEQVRHWRNETLVSLRTPFPLTIEMQAEFYRVISDRRSRHRFWAVRNKTLIGMAGLTDIQWENGIAEISLLLGPAWRGAGRGRCAVALVLEEAFSRLRLETVFGEVYQCNPATAFWLAIAKQYGGWVTTLPRRKWWDGRLWNSVYFSISREQWLQAKGDDADADGLSAA